MRVYPYVLYLHHFSPRQTSRQTDQTVQQGYTDANRRAKLTLEETDREHVIYNE